MIEDPEEYAERLEEVEEVFSKHRDKLMTDKSVSDVRIEFDKDDEDYFIKIEVKTDSENGFPEQIDGVKIEVFEV